MTATGRWLVGWSIAALIVIAALGVWLGSLLAVLVAPDRVHMNYRIGSASMLPNLAIGDVVRPRRVASGDLRRGAVILFHGAREARFARIVALPGDRFAMARGHVVLDGRVVPLQRVGAGPIVEGAPSTLQAERLPGEARPHRVLDLGPSIGDDRPELTVPAGRLVVLGDNRDEAADSRFPIEQDGTGLVAIDRVIGTLDLVLWSQGFHDRLHPVDRP